MLRRSAAETRQLLIDTGVTMLHERGITAGVTHIRLQDVLRRAGLTTGAAYRLWSDQEAFHRDVAIAATGWRNDMPLTATVRAIRPLVEGGAGLSEVIRVASAAHVDGFDDSTEHPGEPASEHPVESTGTATDDRSLGAPRLSGTFLTTLALRAAARHDPALQAASRARHAESLDSFGELYSTLMHVYGRRFRPPLTLRQFTAAIAALGEGFAIQAIEGEPHPHVDIDTDTDIADTGDDDAAAADGGATRRWTLFGLAVQALVDAFTEPSSEAVRGDK